VIYESSKAAMGSHEITELDVASRLNNMKNRKNQMRRTNITMPFPKEGTQETTYRKCISNMAEPGKLNEGRAQIMSNLKEASIKVGQHRETTVYSTEMAE